MSVLTIDPLITIQEAVLKAVKAGQARSIEATKAVVDLVEPVTSKLPKSPLAGMVPEPSAVLDAQLTFVDDLFAAQRDYARELAGVLTPSDH